MTPLLQKARRRRSAFTLVELLVVMAIVAVLLSLLMAAVQRARESGRRTQAHTEIREFGTGIALFKQKFTVDYIPSRIVLRDDGAYVAGNQLEIDSLTWLKTAWPNITFPIDWNRNGNTSASEVVTLEGHQCLVFFLGGDASSGQPDGFSTNPRNPMAAGGKRIGPFAQFQVDRLKVEANGFRSFVDPWKAQPYAYFTSYSKVRGYNPYTTATPASDCGSLGSNPFADPSTTKWFNADGFQIISAGADKAFGAGGTNLPATGVGEDDIANFSKAVLGSGIQ